jgi:hypothetical protein
VFLTTELASGHRVKAHTVLVCAHAVLVSSVTAHSLLMLAVDLAQGVRVMHTVVSEMTGVRLISTPTAMAAAVVTTHVVVTVHVASKAHHATTTVVAVSTAAATTAAAASSSRVVVLMTATHLLTLKLGLDSLAVRSVSDHGQNGSDAFHEL